MNLIHFLRYNTRKRLTVLAYLYSALYRFEIRFIKPKFLQKGRSPPKRRLPGNTGMPPVYPEW